MKTPLSLMYLPEISPRHLPVKLLHMHLSLKLLQPRHLPVKLLRRRLSCYRLKEEMRKREQRRRDPEKNEKSEKE